MKAIKPAPGGGTRRGGILVIVCVLSLVISVALFSLSYLTRTDIISSSRLLREITATSIAESIAAQCEARVNTHQWSQRFWYEAAYAAGIIGLGDEPPPLSMTPDSPWLDFSKESTPPGDYDFVANVKDLAVDPTSPEGTLREYRLYVEVTVKGETYAFSWDKRHEGSLLATLNWEQTTEVKHFEQVPPATAAPDVLIETIKTTANDAAPPDTTSVPVGIKLCKLKHDEKNFKARAFPGNPAKAPGPVTQTGSVVWLDPTGTSGSGVTPDGK